MANTKEQELSYLKEVLFKVDEDVTSWDISEDKEVANLKTDYEVIYSNLLDKVNSNKEASKEDKESDLGEILKKLEQDYREDLSDILNK